MKRIIFLAISALLAFSEAFSQTVGYLDNDRRVHKTVMENGLTCYLVKNSAIAGYADFTLVQKRNGGRYGGSGGDAGLEELTRCLSLTEIRNFPDGGLFLFLDNIGLDDRKDVEIGTEDGCMTFSLKNVPLSGDADLLDSILLALYNISSGMISDEGSLSKGKEFFANSCPAGMFPEAAGYSADDVRRFYEDNYRPDMQALIIAGDFDVRLAEAKVKALFQTIPKPEPSRSLSVNPEPRRNGEKFFYFKDCEADYAGITLDFPADGIADELKNTAVPFVYDYLSDISAYAIKWRLTGDLYNLPFYVRSLDVAAAAPFQNGRAFSVSLRCAPCDYRQAYAFLASEMNRLAEEGFSESEFRRAEGAVLSGLQHKYDGRGFRDNEVFTKMCVANFTENSNIAGIELYKSYIDEAKGIIDVNVLNEFVRSLFGCRKNNTVTCVSPQECGGLDSVIIPALPHYEDRPPVFEPEKEEVKKSGKGRKIVNNSMGFVYSLLDNGAVTVYKRQKIEPGMVSFEAVAPEGVSLTDGDYVLLQKYINEAAGISKTGGMDKYRLAERKAESLIELERVISAGESRLVGKFHKDCLDEFLRLVSLYFGKCDEDEPLFEKYAAAGGPALDACAGNSPEEVLEALCRRDIFTGRRENLSDSSSAISSSDYRKTLDSVNSLFSDAANFSFIFIGDFDEERLAEKADLYIGSLPGTHRVRREKQSGDFPVANYDRTAVRHVPMAFPRCLHGCRLTFPSKQNVEERALSEVVALIIRHEIKKRFSRDGFLIASGKEFYSCPQEVMTLDFRFSSASELQYFENDFKKTLADLAERGVGVNELKTAKRNVSAKGRLLRVTDFDYWHSILRDRFISNKDFFTNWEESVNAVDKESADDFLRKISENGHISLCSVVPDKSE